MSSAHALFRMIDRRRDSLLGFLDYRYMPFALGDTLTWLMNLQVEAKGRELDRISLLLHADPEAPTWRLQPNITAQNYRDCLANLLPAFFCSPMTEAIDVVEHKRLYWAMLAAAALGRRPAWPGLGSQLCETIDYASHKRINAYFQKYGSLPLLASPRGYAGCAADFRDRHLSGRFVVTINIRQRGTQYDKAALHRDSSMEAWMTFLARAARSHPDAVFLVLGGYTEWDRRLAVFPNVLVPRVFGHGLGLDLALLFSGDLFMGTSSGFAAAATFSRVPYVITNYEHAAASFTAIPVGAPRYPFAQPNQTLSWERETPELLMDLFSEAHARCREATDHPERRTDPDRGAR